MLEALSPIVGHAALEAEGVALREAPGFTLIQYAGSGRVLARELGAEPEFGKVEKSEGRTFIRVAPGQVWVLGKEIETRQCLATPLSSGRTRFALEGERARMLLAACAAVDFSRASFGTGAYAMTGIHHTPTLIHCTGPESFHIYAMRSFALSVWETLVDAAQGL
jgi:heterotetrameric sarcosine oxidase gamma subunit